MSIQTIHRLDMFLETLQKEKHPGDSCGEGPCSWCWFEDLVPEMETEVESLQTRVKELEQELAQVNQERSDWKRWLQDSEQQVTALREPIIQLIGQYKTELQMHYGDDIDLTDNIGINMGKAALEASTPPAEEGPEHQNPP